MDMNMCILVELFHFAEVHIAATAQSSLGETPICVFSHAITP